MRETIVSVPRTTIQYQVKKHLYSNHRPTKNATADVDGSFLRPEYLSTSTRFLYYLSVYENLSKNSFLNASVSKADAKVRLLSIHSKFFSNYFIEITKIFEIVYKIKPTPYI